MINGKQYDGWVERLKIGEIMAKCSNVSDEDMDNYASPCCGCGLYDTLNLKIYLPCDEDTEFGAGEFVLPIKPCGILLLLAEQLAAENRLHFGHLDKGKGSPALPLDSEAIKP